MPPNSATNIAHQRTHFYTQNLQTSFTALWGGTFPLVLAINFFLA